MKKPKRYHPRKLRVKANCYKGRPVTLSFFDRRGNEMISDIAPEFRKEHRPSKKRQDFDCTVRWKNGKIAGLTFRYRKPRHLTKAEVDAVRCQVDRQLEGIKEF